MAVEQPFDDRQPALVLEGLCRVYRTRRGEPVSALHDIDLEIHRGEVLTILGPSGCGKSTLLRILAGLDNGYGGRLRWQLDDDGGQRLRTSLVFQQDSTLPWMTVEDNIRIGMAGLKLGRHEIAERTERYMGLVGLSAFRKAYPHELSGGMRQRVAIARALATTPLTLLMDEPLAALDAQTRFVMQEELVRIWEQTDSTVIYITHDIEEALTIGDRTIVMTSRPGRIKHVTTGYRYLSRTQPAAQVRNLAEFRQTAIQLWELIAEEVGERLDAR